MKVVVLGSTGSLGGQALAVSARFIKDFEIIGLAANKNEKILNQQAQNIGISGQNVVLASRDGDEAVSKLAELPEAEIIINTLSGTAGIEPTRRALKAGKTVLLGNKESLVAAGDEIMAIANGRIIPLDSEHNAIFEILRKFPQKSIKKIIIPCSGGPFLGKTQEELKEMSTKEALAHPKWSMGAKISIESATLINKGLEIIEAHYLFDLPLYKIDVTIHPECQIHGIVEFEDGAYSYKSAPNMEEHIENALLYTANMPTPGQQKIHKLENFQPTPPDHKNFPGINIVLDHFKYNRSGMTEFLKKEEATIGDYLENKISFTEIFSQLQLSS